MAERVYDDAQTMYGAPARPRLRLWPPGQGQAKTRMTYRLGLKSWATGALVLAAVTACADTNTETAPTPSTSVAPSASVPSADPSPTSPSAAAAADATALMHRYFAVIDQISQHPKSPVKALGSVAISSELTAEKRFLTGQHQRGEKQVGNTKVDQLTVQSVSLGSAASTDAVPTVIVDVCWDVSNVDVLGRNGQSIVSPSRPDAGWTRYTVANYSFAIDPTDGWRVSSAQDLKQPPCTAS